MTNDPGTTPEPEPADVRFTLRTTALERRYATFLSAQLGVSENAAFRMLIRRGWQHIHECVQPELPARPVTPPPAARDATPGGDGATPIPGDRPLFSSDATTT